MSQKEQKTVLWREKGFQDEDRSYLKVYLPFRFGFRVKTSGKRKIVIHGRIERRIIRAMLNWINDFSLMTA